MGGVAVCDVVGACGAGSGGAYRRWGRRHPKHGILNRVPAFGFGIGSALYPWRRFGTRHARLADGRMGEAAVRVRREYVRKHFKRTIGKRGGRKGMDG